MIPMKLASKVVRPAAAEMMVAIVVTLTVTTTSPLSTEERRKMENQMVVPSNELSGSYLRCNNWHS